MQCIIKNVQTVDILCSIFTHISYNLLDQNQAINILDDSSRVNKEGPSFTAYGINFSNADIGTLAAGEMINDNIATVLLRQVYKYYWLNKVNLAYTNQHNSAVFICFPFREQACPFPIIDTLFYSILCGEQDGKFTSSRYLTISFNNLVYYLHSESFQTNLQ